MHIFDIKEVKRLTENLQQVSTARTFNRWSAVEPRWLCLSSTSFPFFSFLRTEQLYHPCSCTSVESVARLKSSSYLSIFEPVFR